jgi:hypothetical protein
MSFSIADTSPYGVQYSGNGVIFDTAKVLSRLVKQDHGLENTKKRQLLLMLQSPDVLESILVGATGMMISSMIAKYTNMSQPAKTLLSLAGYGIGNMLYDMLKKNKFSTFNSSTGTAKIKL